MPTGVYPRKPCPDGCACGKHRPQQWSAARRAAAAAAQRDRTPQHRQRLSAALKGNANSVIHGDSSRAAAVPEYLAWQNMRARCNNPRHPRYADYGGRGITITPRWDDYVLFRADVGPRPGPEFSIDRIDNDGPYAPDNVRWATRSQQQSNRRAPKAVR